DRAPPPPQAEGPRPPPEICAFRPDSGTEAHRPALIQFLERRTGGKTEGGKDAGRPAKRRRLDLSLLPCRGQGLLAVVVQPYPGDILAADLEQVNVVIGDR